MSGGVNRNVDKKRGEKGIFGWEIKDEGGKQRMREGKGKEGKSGKTEIGSVGDFEEGRKSDCLREITRGND